VKDQTAGPGRKRLDNREAVAYSRRLFLVGYFILPSILWVTFLALAFNSTTLSAETTAFVLLTLLWAAIVCVGYALTLGRTPSEVTFISPSTIVLKSGIGTNRRLELTADSYYIPLEEYGRSFFAPWRCELIEFRRLAHGACRIVAAEGLVEDILPRGDRQPSDRGSAPTT